MKVTRNTPDQLVLDHVPWVFGGLLTLFTITFAGIGIAMLFGGDPMGVMFLVMGGGLGIACLAVFVERLQVILNRTTGRLRMRRRTIFGYEEDVHELTALRGAIVESSYSKNGGDTFRPALVIDTPRGPEPRPVSQIFSSGRGARRAVDQINAWLDVREEDIPKAFR